jgi:murein L,D-transpeptidase YcbB/YkuD
MRPGYSSCRAGSPLVLIFTLALALTPTASYSSEANASAPAPLATSQATLSSLVRAGRLDDLRWPDFSDVRAQVDIFYSRSAYAPAWLQNGLPTPQALRLIKSLRQADEQGLRAEDYDSSRWPQRLENLQGRHPASAEARFDLALTVCVMRYVSALRDGRISPQYFKFDLDTRPKFTDLPVFVRQHLAEGTDLDGELAGIEPPFEGYRELQKALLKVMLLAKQDDGEKLPVPLDIGYPGPPYAGFPRLARLLLLLGDLPADYSVAAASSKTFDPDLMQGVRRYQERHGLASSGYLDPVTVEELNVPLTQRLEQIRLAMERFRWLRRDVHEPVVVINIPGFHLYALTEDRKLALSMRVDVGEDFDSTRTPVMQDAIEYVVFRPYWSVPLDIQQNELYPILLTDPSYLQKYSFDFLTPAGQTVSVGRLTNELLQAIRSGRLRMRQRPGSDNPMGLVKFVFPNRYSVYLHDSPMRDINFLLPQRVASHGCIHLENPAELAAWVLRDQPQWTLDNVRQAMETGQDNRSIKLTRPLPVLLFYTTVSTVLQGKIHFYRDIYGYDTALQQALAKGYPYPR